MAIILFSVFQTAVAKAIALFGGTAIAIALNLNL
jgi:hypothetical protein